MAAKVPISALYGKEDGLYNAAIVAEAAQTLGKSNVLYIDSCAHGVYTDRQDVFLSAVTAK